MSARRAESVVDAGVCAQRRVDDVVQCSRGTAARALAVVAANRARSWAKMDYEHGAHHLVLNADVRYRGKCSRKHLPFRVPNALQRQLGGVERSGDLRAPAEREL